MLRRPPTTQDRTPPRELLRASEELRAERDYLIGVTPSAVFRLPVGLEAARPPGMVRCHAEESVWRRSHQDATRQHSQDGERADGPRRNDAVPDDGPATAHPETSRIRSTGLPTGSSSRARWLSLLRASSLHRIAGRRTCRAKPRRWRAGRSWTGLMQSVQVRADLPRSRR